MCDISKKNVHLWNFSLNILCICADNSVLRQSLDSVASGARTTLPESQNHTSFFKLQESSGNINLLQHSVHTVSETPLTMKSNIVFFQCMMKGIF